LRSPFDPPQYKTPQRQVVEQIKVESDLRLETEDDILSAAVELTRQEDWEAIQETLYLTSIPSFVDSIKEAEKSSRQEWVNAKDLGLH
jgi:PHD/YefM family antitoxin component YafN of YafNO toxin-antitoxin module